MGTLISRQLTLDDPFSEVATRAAERQGVPREMASEAADICRTRLAGQQVDHGRAEAYFWGVVRRAAFADRRHPDSKAMRTRLLLASVAADLREAGLSQARVYEELLAHYGDSLGPELLAGYRPRATGGGSQRTVMDETISPLGRDSTHSRRASRRPSFGPHTSTTSQTGRPSIVAASA